MSRCPRCGREVQETHYACGMGAKGGRSRVNKARSSEQARAAALRRWAKWGAELDGQKDGDNAGET